MALLIDPKTGDKYEFPDENADAARERFGVITPDEYAKQQAAEAHQKELDARSIGEKAADLGTLAAQSVARGAMAPGMALTRAITGQLPGQTPQSELPADQQSPLQESVFGPEAQQRRELHPYLAGAFESLPSALLGAATAGAGLAPGGAVGILGADSALQGMSQEAVDAVTQKRDFSWKSAGMLGLTNLAIGGVAHVGFGALGKALGGGAEAAAAETGSAGAGAGTAPEGTAAPPGMRRNYLAEVDPGELPEAVKGGKRAGKLQSGGAAAANFDELPAAQAITEITDGKVNAGKIAEAAPAIRDHLSLETENSFNAVDDITRNDATIGAKHEDFAAGAAEWTPEIREAQDKWVSSASDQGLKLADELADTKHAGGLGEAAKNEILKGLERVQDAGEGAERNVALDNMKRGIDRLTKRFGNMANSAVDQETRAALMNRLEEYSDHLRDGLKSPELFGRNGPLQEAQNKAYVSLIDPLARVQKDIFQVTGKKFGAVGMQALEQRADPDKILRLFSDPRGGGELFKRDLAASLDAAQDLARARQEYGLSKLERLPELIEQLQNIRDDMNTAEVLHVAEAKAGVGGHGTGGASMGAALGANALVHAAEFGGRAVGLPLGQMARSTGAMGKVARGLDRAAEALGMNTDMAKPGTATRNLLDRYAERIKGGEALSDAKRVALMPEALKKFLDQAHAPPPVIPPGGGGAGTGNSGAPPRVPPGAPANDIAGKVAGALALAGGAGALLAPGQANAAEPPLGPDGQTMLPEQAAARQALAQKLATQSPEERAASIATAEALARIGDRTKQRVDRAVSDLFTVAVDPNAQQKFRSPAARDIDQRSADLDVPRAVARFMGKKTDDPVAAWQDKRQLLERVMTDPSALAQTMAQNLGDLPHKEPEIFTQMVAQTMKAASYLAEKMPQPTGKSALDPGGYPPSFEDITTIAGYWVGALHPLDTLDDLAQNDLVPEQMQAVKDLWPDAYSMFQSSAMRSIHALSQKGGTVPLDALQQIDSALQLDGAGEPALSSSMARLIQTATQQAAASGAPVNSPSPLQSQGTPIQSKAPARLASASLGTLHDA